MSEGRGRPGSFEQPLLLRASPPQDEPQERPRRGIRWLFCCGGVAVGPPRERRRAARHGGAPRERGRRGHKRRRSSHRHAAAGALSALKAPSLQASEPLSFLSEDEWHEVQDAFSVASDDGVHSLPASPRSSAARGRSAWASAAGSADGSGGDSDWSEDEGGGGGGGGGAAATIGARLVSCLSLMRHDSGGGAAAEEAAAAAAAAAAGVAPPRAVVVSRGPRPAAGSSFPRRAPDVEPSAARHCWDEPDATTFHVRGADYLKTRLKVLSGPSIYRLVAVDVFKTPSKASHVARAVALPPARDPVCFGDAVIPPLLIFNLQLPRYPPGLLLGASDGPGESVVYYFALREDFDPAAAENRGAVGLLARFAANGREADGAPTRERLKFIGRVANPEEWAVEAPLSNPEYRLLTSYNEKPLLTRPQQTFYTGPGSRYLEVDCDVHCYNYLARRALWGYHSRLRSVVWDNSFVLEGRAADELPELILACARIYRTDFSDCRTFADCLSSAATSASAAAAAGPASFAVRSLSGSRAGSSSLSEPVAAAAAAAAAAAGAKGSAAAAAGGTAEQLAAAGAAAAAAAPQAPAVAVEAGS